MRNTILIVVTLSALFGMSPYLMSQALEQSPRPTLTGTVLDSSGAVIGGATVEIRNIDGTVRRSVKSDRNGSFAIAALPAGNYRLVASCAGFQEKEVSVVLAASGVPVPASNHAGSGCGEHNDRRPGP